MKSKPKTKRVKKIKAWAIVSDFGIMYDGNGKTLALAVYAQKSEIGPSRISAMTEDDRIVPIEITIKQ